MILIDIDFLKSESKSNTNKELRIVGIMVEGVFALIKAISMLPTGILKGQSANCQSLVLNFIKQPETSIKQFPRCGCHVFSRCNYQSILNIIEVE